LLRERFGYCYREILAHKPTMAEWLWREVPTLQFAFENPIELDRLLHNGHLLKPAPRSGRTKLESAIAIGTLVRPWCCPLPDTHFHWRTSGVAPVFWIHRVPPLRSTVYCLLLTVGELLRVAE
jgi:hypothetical protein